jgi:hypothetical protein
VGTNQVVKQLAKTTEAGQDTDSGKADDDKTTTE